ncbi:hypothetical protein MTR67_031881 [Solanum verrucosum]|uniref:SWIM-type domain-containing protein n=1 Tax=Solanum verrucosum TaxID=315347 RepID=A0AAF0U3B9_SOLVR|nr:hypothetical protein MTR67_031881 [Solanum verrucosum]
MRPYPYSSFFFFQREPEMRNPTTRAQNESATTQQHDPNREPAERCEQHVVLSSQLVHLRTKNILDRARYGDDVVPAIDISHNNEPYLVTIDANTEGETSEEENDENEPYLVTLDAATEELEKGTSFKNLEEAKRVVSYYSIARKVALRVGKSDSVRVRYKCIVGCPFVCLISKVKKGQGFEIKTLQTKHTCPEAFKNRRATQQALAHYFKKRVQNDPKCKVNEMRKIVDDNFRLNISYSKMNMVKTLVLEKLDGSYVDDFNKMEGYAQELRDNNPVTDVIINISKEVLLEHGQIKFLRMYICIQALKSGWRAGLRPFIGLDGTFLKGKFKGILLVALGQDSMKHFYPLAWAVVDRETIRTWKWFIELMRNSLGLADGERLTLMSDIQKGLIGAVGDLLPKAQHRWCARHIEANWSRSWSGVQMKKMFWWSAWSTYEEEFNNQLKSMGFVSKQAAKDLFWYPPQHWCRTFFDTVCKNHSCENNFTESFNKWILEARAKPIIKMLEDIRINVMKRLKQLEEEGKRWTEEYCPYFMDLYHDFRMTAQGCQVVANGDLGYEVAEGIDRHVVNLATKKCTCRTWDLTEIPCPHAIKALEHDRLEPLNEMHWWYSKEAYLFVYQPKIQPVRGEKFWKIDPSQAMQPPQIHKLVGRPKLKRVREKDEARKREGLWSKSRKGLQMTCGNCSAVGHNRRRCPLLQKGRQVLPAPQLSEENESVFMPTPGFVASSSRQTSQQSSQAFNEASGSSKSKRKNVSKDKVDAIPKRSKNSGKEIVIAPSIATVDEVEDGIESEDKDIVFAPRMISKEKTRLQMKKLQQQPIGSRRISFRGDENGASIPTNLPYSPKKLTWKDKARVTSNQLTKDKEKKIGKLKAKRGKH